MRIIFPIVHWLIDKAGLAVELHKKYFFMIHTSFLKILKLKKIIRWNIYISFEIKQVYPRYTVRPCDKQILGALHKNLLSGSLQTFSTHANSTNYSLKW